MGGKYEWILTSWSVSGEILDEAPEKTGLQIKNVFLSEDIWQVYVTAHQYGTITTRTCIILQHLHELKKQFFFSFSVLSDFVFYCSIPVPFRFLSTFSVRVAGCCRVFPPKGLRVLLGPNPVFFLLSSYHS